MILEPSDGRLWKVTPDPARIGSRKALARPFFVTSEDLARQLLSVDMDVSNIGMPFPLSRNLKITQIYSNFTVKVAQTFESRRAILNVKPNIGPEPNGTSIKSNPTQTQWEKDWARFIENKIVDRGVAYYQLRAELPMRKWEANMTMLTWGKGFVQPSLLIISPNDPEMLRGARRWIGGNMDGSLHICWGDVQVNDPANAVATLESFDSLFFNSVFNEDLQRDDKRWHMTPDDWHLPSDVDYIPQQYLISLPR